MGIDGAQPFQGCGSLLPVTQGSSCLATLGLIAQSLWDWRDRNPAQKLGYTQGRGKKTMRQL